MGNPDLLVAALANGCDHLAQVDDDVKAAYRNENPTEVGRSWNISEVQINQHHVQASDDRNLIENVEDMILLVRFVSDHKNQV